MRQMVFMIASQLGYSIYAKSNSSQCDLKKLTSFFSVNAASLALMLSKEPWHGPIGCCRVGLLDGKLKVNPTLEELNSSSNTMNLLYAGTKSRTLM